MSLTLKTHLLQVGVAQAGQLQMLLSLVQQGAGLGKQLQDTLHIFVELLIMCLIPAI